MTAPSAPRVILCPNCRAAVGVGSVVCESCGGILPLEKASGWALGGIRNALARFNARYGERSALLWTLALTPILVGPPVIALILLILDRREQPTRAKPLHDHTFVAVVSVINILLGVLFWRWLGAQSFELVQSIWQWLRFPNAPRPLGRIWPA